MLQLKTIQEQTRLRKRQAIIQEISWWLLFIVLIFLAIGWTGLFFY